MWIKIFEKKLQSTLDFFVLSEIPLKEFTHALLKVRLFILGIMVGSIPHLGDIIPSI
jgi:hypothetical protein